MKANNKMIEQEQLYFDSLSGKEKRDYFTVFFISELVFELSKKRKDAKITQTKLAKAMGVKQTYVSKIENLEKIPTIETVAKYLYALNLSLSSAKEVSTSFVREYKTLADINFYEIMSPNYLSEDSEEYNEHDTYIPLKTQKGKLALSIY